MDCKDNLSISIKLELLKTNNYELKTIKEIEKDTLVILTDTLQSKKK